MKGRPIRHDPKAAIGVETQLRALVVQVLCPTHDAAAIMSAFSINSDQVLGALPAAHRCPAALPPALLLRLAAPPIRGWAQDQHWRLDEYARSP
jgi:hypothetical protein